MLQSASVGSAPKKALKRKRVSKKKIPSPESKSLKLEEPSESIPTSKLSAGPPKTVSPQVFDSLTMAELAERFPILKNEELVQKFLNVPMTSNQKGRIRQVLKDNLKGTADVILPEVIHSRIQNVLKSSKDLTDADLRKIRILYNMLKTAVKTEKNPVEKKSKEEKTKKKHNKEHTKANTENKEKKGSPEPKKEQLVKKVKGKKRYVVFIGNLPLTVDKEMIMKHFSELDENIVSVRIPPPRQDKRSAIAYVELANEPTYELALSKHHSMMGSKRINVLYTTQQKTKISKTEAKSKSAKLVALQKSGKLLGSVPLNRKRSQRRARQRRALAKEKKE